MDAAAQGTNRPTNNALWDRLPRPWAILGSACLVGLLLGSALLLILRRSAGALSQPLPATWLLLTGILIAVAVIAARRLPNLQELLASPAWLRQIIHWGPTVAVAMFAVALSIEGTSLFALTLYLILIVGAEFFAEQAPQKGTFYFFKQTDHRSRVSSPPETTPPQEPVLPVRLEKAFGGRAELNLEDAAEEPIDENIWQQMSRLHTAEGEVITGWVKAAFQPGERTSVLHVAFCPPLLKTPTVQIEQLSGPPARIKVGQVLPQGARFEIRLNTSGTETETLMLEFVALEQGEVVEE